MSLYEKLWRPLASHIRDSEVVFLAPDGALNMISFAALRSPDGRYLVEKFPIHYFSSGRDLMRLEDKPASGRGLFALGDPDFDAFASTWLPGEASEDTALALAGYATRNVRSGCGELNEIAVEPLPATRKEIEMLASAWSSAGAEPVETHLGVNATEDRFKADAPGKRVIHLATHGYFLEGRCQPELPGTGAVPRTGIVGENPLLLSGLFLAGANLHGEGADSLGAEDGILTAYEVSAMDLEGTDLVVLSACETGLGRIEDGEGVYGLRRAFEMAGARTVISALWPVPDETTANMMGQLYARQSESIPVTMRRVQLARMKELRDNGLPDHPYSWAGFVAIGDWR